MPLTNAERAARCERISNIAGLIASIGALMLVLRAVDALGPVELWPVLGPLGVLVALPAGIVSMAAAQLAERYSEPGDIDLTV